MKLLSTLMARAGQSTYRDGVRSSLVSLLCLATVALAGCASQPIPHGPYTGAKYKGRGVHQGIPTWSTMNDSPK